MISFSETFDKVRDCFTDSSIGSLVEKLESVTIIRDVAGKIRLFLELSDNHGLNETEIKNLIDPLASLLSRKLESYYGNDIWLSTENKDGYKALIKTIKEERYPDPWDDESGNFKWYILERHIAKQAWTNKQRGQPPWNFEVVERGHKPAIVSFFSFKGGVGRTSTLAATALTLG